MKAILFPGQGSQKAGMATEFHSNFKIVKDIFSRGRNTLTDPNSSCPGSLLKTTPPPPGYPWVPGCREGTP